MTRSIERCLVEAHERMRGEEVVVATVVATRGSVYRRPGARMLLTRDGAVTGSVSGGCLESDLSGKAWWRTEGGAAVVVTYDSTAEEGETFGVGCNGAVDVLLERAERGCVDVLELMSECRRTQERAAVATRFTGVGIGTRMAMRADGSTFGDFADGRVKRLLAEAMESGETRVVDGVLVEALVPAPTLFVLGTQHDAVPVVAMGRGLGWDVVVCAPSARLSARVRLAAADELATGTPERIAARVDAAARPVVVLMSHDYDRDKGHLRAMLGTRALYIGALGPRARTRQMLDELGVADDARLHAPVGLELGAETPAEIAVSIAAEIQAELARASAGSLRDKVGAIHEAA